MKEYRFSPEFIKRYRDFLSSREFGDIDNHSKSDYWKYHADAVNMQISNNKIIIDGKSGFYVPSENKNIRIFKGRLQKLISNPKLLIPYFKRKLGLSESGIKLLNYFEAFDKIMNRDPVSNPDISPYRINFNTLKDKPGVVASIDEIQNNYFAKDKYKLSSHIIASHYFSNILLASFDLKRAKTILEIGAGNGNLLTLLFSLTEGTTFIDVDLPETLSHSILHISDLFPDARLLLPNEIGPILPDLVKYDFIFLTPKQTQLISDKSIDLAINIDSFQEMTHIQIEEYFKLIQRCSKNESYFFTRNRVEKIPCGPDSYEKETTEPPNRFSDYPWASLTSTTLIFEICKLARLVQLDNAYIRLEKIVK